MTQIDAGLSRLGCSSRVALTTLVDLGFHLSAVYPAGAPLDDALALLATSYRSTIGIASAWLQHDWHRAARCVAR